MKFSENWLRSFVHLDLDSDALSQQLTMLGLEVENVTPVAAEFTGIIIGEVLATEPHPDADRLKICQVKVSAKETLTIVCGGKNVRSGLKVPVIQVGAKLGDVKIKRAKLRGVESVGMICSETELGIADSSDGIMELPEEAPIGVDIRTYLELDDNVFDVALTPNRGDCASILGLARDLAAVQGSPLINPEQVPTVPVITESLAVKVSAPEACPRYVGRVVKNIDPTASSPLWLVEKLRRSGLRSIHPVVDISNFVMLELGQPLHAFDLSTLSGPVEVRLANLGESLTLLDEQAVSLDPQSLIIADSKGPLALAGVMGGLHSGVTESTQHLFLESAYFDPVTIRKTARRFNLSSDSSYRFERGVDYEGQVQAIERMSELLLAIVGGELGPITTVSEPHLLPAPVTITLRQSRILSVLGIQVPSIQVEAFLQALAMNYEAIDNGWEVTPPSYRFDISIEVDLIEEIARMYGYQRIQGTALQSNASCLPVSDQQLTTSRVLHYWADQGYDEIRSYSFVDPKLELQLAPQHQAVALSNPISSDMSVMQTTLWSGLLSTLQYNLARQVTSAKLFEVAMVFEPVDGAIKQTKKIGGCLFGRQSPEQWAKTTRQVDFYDLKGDITRFLALTGDSRFRFQPASHPALHPGQTAQIFRGEQAIGWCGKLHPKAQSELNIQGDVFLFELDYDNTIKSLLVKHESISKFPGLRRDLALVVAQSVPVQALVDTIKNAGTNLLQRVEIFDIYEGQGIDDGKKSVAVSLQFQLNDRTLTDTEVNELLVTIMSTLQQQFDAVLRG